MSWPEYIVCAALAGAYTFLIVCFLDAPIMEDEKNEAD